jgi:membrane protease YdiL (CAAX protease family)
MDPLPEQGPAPLEPEDAPLMGVEIVPEALVLPPRPHPGFGWALLWCLGFLLVTQLVPALVGAVILIFLVMGTPGGLDRFNDPQVLFQSEAFAKAMMPAMLLAQILSILMSWLVLRLVVGKHWPAIVALRRPSLPHLLFALVGLPGLMVIVMGVDGLARGLPSFVNLEETMTMLGKWPWPLGVLIIGVGPGIGEELWCRGFLGRGLVGRYGYFGGVLLTSILFGLIHLEPRQVVYATVMGVFLHGAYLATRSLFVPILLHMTNNSLSILAMHLANNFPALKAVDTPAEQIPLIVYAAAILLTAAVAWALFQSRARLVDLPISTSITTVPILTSITSVPSEVVDQPGPATWRPPYPSVAYPPPGKATQVMQPWPAWHSWLLVAIGLTVFVGSCFLGG